MSHRRLGIERRWQEIAEFFEAGVAMPQEDRAKALKAFLSRAAGTPLQALRHVALNNLADWVPVFAAIGVKLDEADANGIVGALPWAATAVSEQTALALLDAGAAVTRFSGKSGMPLLHRAVDKNLRLLVARLLAAGAPVNEFYKGSTPLHLCWDPHILQMLLEAGADKEAECRARNGQERGTALLRLAGAQSWADKIQPLRVQCFLLLMESGADLDAHVSGASAKDLALADPRLAPLVRAHLARQAALVAIDEFGPAGAPVIGAGA